MLAAVFAFTIFETRIVIAESPSKIMPSTAIAPILDHSFPVSINDNPTAAPASNIIPASAEI